MVTIGISLGQFKTKKKAEDKINRSKERVKGVIDYNKKERGSIGKIYRDTNINEFKYYIKKESKDMFENPRQFPFYVYVETKPIHRWIFES